MPVWGWFAQAGGADPVGYWGGQQFLRDVILVLVTAVATALLTWLIQARITKKSDTRNDVRDLRGDVAKLTDKVHQMELKVVQASYQALYPEAYVVQRVEPRAQVPTQQARAARPSDEAETPGANLDPPGPAPAKAAQGRRRAKTDDGPSDST